MWDLPLSINSNSTEKWSIYKKWCSIFFCPLGAVRYRLVSPQHVLVWAKQRDVQERWWHSENVGAGSCNLCGSRVSVGSVKTSCRDLLNMLLLTSVAGIHLKVKQRVHKAAEGEGGDSCIFKDLSLSIYFEYSNIDFSHSLKLHSTYSILELVLHNSSGTHRSLSQWDFGKSHISVVAATGTVHVRGFPWKSVCAFAPAAHAAQAGSGREWQGVFLRSFQTPSVTGISQSRETCGFVGENHPVFPTDYCFVWC